jgi:xanthine dehydrogenase YagS FAD-binding subunit
LKSFAHINVRTTAEAIRLLRDYHGRAVLIAGGTDLLGLLKDRLWVDYPEALVNIKTIPDIDFIKEEPSVLRIGALTRLDNIAISPILKEKYGILSQAALSVGTPQIRRMGTLGGNLVQEVRCWYYRYPHQMGGRFNCRRKGGADCPGAVGDNRYLAIFKGQRCFAVCPSDAATALAALNASVLIIGPEGVRTLPVEALYGHTEKALRMDEMITEIQVPQPPEKSEQKFLKFRVRSTLDFAIVSVAVLLTRSRGICREARIVLGGVASRPFRASGAEQAIQGRKINSAVAETASETAVAEAVPLSRNAYKIQLVKTLVKRALLS